MGVIPKEIAGTFLKLQNQALWLLLYWQVYNQLFNHANQLNNTAPPNAISLSFWAREAVREVVAIRR